MDIIKQCFHCKKELTTEHGATKYCGPECQRASYDSRKCRQCGDRIPLKANINGITKTLQNRTYCLKCVPFAEKLQQDPVLKEEERKAKNREKAKRAYEKNDYGELEKHKCYNNKKLIVDLVGGCQLCGYNKCYKSITFHHVIEEQKAFNLPARMFRYTFEKIKEELLKCIVACSNCHGEIHGDLINSDIVIKQHENFIKAIENFDSSLWFKKNLK